MNINVVVKLQFDFSGSNVKGNIWINPETLYNSIYFNRNKLFDIDINLAPLKTLVVRTMAKKIQDNLNPDIYITSGSVINGLMTIDHRWALFLLKNYVESEDNKQSEEYMKVLDIFNY